MHSAYLQDGNIGQGTFFYPYFKDLREGPSFKFDWAFQLKPTDRIGFCFHWYGSQLGPFGLVYTDSNGVREEGTLSNAITHAYLGLFYGRLWSVNCWEFMLQVGAGYNFFRDEGALMDEYEAEGQFISTQLHGDITFRFNSNMGLVLGGSLYHGSLNEVDYTQYNETQTVDASQGIWGKQSKYHIGLGLRWYFP